MSEVTFRLFDWVKPLFDSRWLTAVIYGGRGSGKTVGVVHFLLLQALKKKQLIVCARITKAAIEKSVYSEIKNQIVDLGLSEYFEIKATEILCKTTGSKFTFEGLYRGPESIKGSSRVNYFWIDEAEAVSAYVLSIIEPTLRENGSMLILTFNPKSRFYDVYDRFVAKEPSSREYVHKTNWSQNPFFSERLAWLRQGEYDKAVRSGDMSVYNWIWEGHLLENSSLQVLYGKWVIEDFEECAESESYYGLDFGYSVDPTAIVRCYIKDDVLYITHELYEYKLEIDHIGALAEKQIPGFKRARVTADSARPESISFLKRQGYDVVACEKGKGSVEDGIEFLRTFNRIVIHPRCLNFQKEANLYSWKVDKNTNEIRTPPVPEDAYNHLIDALRYALERVMKARKADYSGFLKLHSGYF